MRAKALEALIPCSSLLIRYLLSCRVIISTPFPIELWRNGSGSATNSRQCRLERAFIFPGVGVPPINANVIEACPEVSSVTPFTPSMSVPPHVAPPASLNLEIDVVISTPPHLRYYPPLLRVFVRGRGTILLAVTDRPMTSPCLVRVFNQTRKSKL